MESKAVAGVEIKELTVKAIYEWLSEHLSSENTRDAMDPAHLVDAFLLEGVALSDLARMTNLTVSQMESMLPQSLQRIAAECKEVNRHFFQLRALVMTGVRPTSEPSLNDSDTSSPK